MSESFRGSAGGWRQGLAVLGALVAMTAACGHAGAQDAGRPPNIVVMLVDDLGYGDPRCYNPDSKIPTPNIDRLAAQGMRFTDVHSPSAVCTPTRYGLLTGRYCWRTRLQRGVLQGYDRLLIDDGRPTLASVLKQRGYTTAGIGKWHLGLGDQGRTDYHKPFGAGPQTVGFDYYFGIPSSLDFEPYVFFENDRATEAPTERIAASASQREGGKGFWREGFIAPSFRHADVLPVTTRKAVEFLDRQAKTPGKPFLLYFPVAAPHTPWLPTGEFRGKTPVGDYGDFVAQTDATLGAVLEVLDRGKLAEDTLLVFTSDNGGHWLPSDIAQWGHRSNLSWRGQKADVYEGGHRVPFVVRWPGKVRPGSTSDQTLCLTDLFATCAAAAGARVPEGAGEDSFNFLSVLRGQAKAPIREAVIYHSGDGHFAIRAGEWKLMEKLGSGGFTPPRTEQPKPGGPEGQLYNLAQDPGETKNLYQERPEVVQRLKALLEKIRSEGRSRPAAG